jgi:H+-transporting ATPase
MSGEASGKTPPPNDLKSLALPELQTKLGSSPDGLSQAEAHKRLAQYGPNEIADKQPNPFLKFLAYFWGPIPWMIEAAVILSALARHWPDFFIILLLLVANAVVGFWEERQAGNAIGSLRRRVNWCPVTSSDCASATSCRPTPVCWMATPWKWINLL